MSKLHNLKNGVADSGDMVNLLELASADGAITIPERGTKTVMITKGTAAALTLATPTLSQNGVEICFVSATAAAHTITAATIGFNDGGASSDVGTLSGAKGDGFTVVAYANDWYVKARQGVTFA